MSKLFHPVLLAALLLILAGRPAIASPDYLSREYSPADLASYEVLGTTDPTEISLDTALSMIKASQLEKNEFAHVTESLLRNIRDGFHMWNNNHDSDKTTWSAQFGSGNCTTTPTTHQARYDAEGRNRAGSTEFCCPDINGHRAQWIAPLSTAEAKSCVQLVKKLGPDSSILADPATVKYYGTASGDEHCHILVEFYADGFLRACYVNDVDPKAAQLQQLLEFAGAKLLRACSLAPNRRISRELKIGNGGIDKLGPDEWRGKSYDFEVYKTARGRASYAKQYDELLSLHAARFKSILSELLKRAAAHQVSPAQARKQLWALCSEEQQSVRPHPFAKNWVEISPEQPEVYNGVVKALKTLYPTVVADLKPPVEVDYVDLSSLYYNHGLYSQWADMAESLSIASLLKQTDRANKTFNNRIYFVLNFYMDQARATGDKNTYHRCCNFVLHTIQQLKESADKSWQMPKPDAQLECLAKICQQQLKSPSLTGLYVVPPRFEPISFKLEEN